LCPIVRGVFQIQEKIGANPRRYFVGLGCHRDLAGAIFRRRLISVYHSCGDEATMPRARYPGANERELYRTTRIEEPKAQGTRVELVLLAVVLIVTAAQLIW
jgi:hypothetical protein